MPQNPGESTPPVNRIRAHTGPLWPYLVLVAVPVAIFVLPDVVDGHLLLTGDNLQQNYPLHVLVGSMYRHGELPTWNPYIFSGTPLLAGFNAGAFYPLVGLFVVLPDRAAWIATEVVVFSGVAVGMYVFLRAMALSTVACLLGASTFAFSGTVLSQVNHLDMTEGFVAIPWMLLAVLHIVREGRWRWSILLGVAFASVILAGAPEAMLDEALLVIAFAALSAGLDAGRWWRVLSRCGAGALLALSLAAIQWLPGLEAISNSQRAGNGAAFAAIGSYPLRFSVLGLVPYINGGYGNLGERSYFAGYNLPEVGIYLGILPLIAILTLLYPRWPSRISSRDRLTWYLVGLVGFLLAVGSATPLEHLFNQIPLYGHQRLQSRNMITVSTAVCVLFAGWIDRTGAPSARGALGAIRPHHGRRPTPAGRRPGHVGVGLSRHAGSLLRPRRHLGTHRAHGARGDAVRPGALCGGGGDRLAQAEVASHQLGRGCHALRHGGSRGDGAHEPAGDVPAERARRRPDAGSADDGGQPVPGGADHQL